ncbi:MAG: gliding motility-associated C-terminal domain-containing protein [Cyclobacteriaceae bacterium]|nr:gliding motility-associated C-terminal domain-containing protein [Cyclobacteriaceae bacterium]
MNVFKIVRLFLFIVSMLTIGQQVYATHLRAGEIIVERVSCNALTFKITVTVFTNTKNTTVKFGGDVDISYIYFGDGQKEFVPEQPNIIRYDLDPDGSIATASYTVFHTYTGYQQYKISYQEPNRNGGVLNMDNSINTLFYIETVINLDPFLDAQGGCSNSPKLLVPPIDRACIGVAWFHNPGAYDPDGDSLSYEMVIPFSAENVPVVNYRPPNAQGFYSNFNQGNEQGNGQPIFGIDPVTGTITWDAPGRAGEYNIAFVIKEWRKINGSWYPMGFVRRDMQIIVEDCDNERPDLEEPEDICVEAGTLIRIKIRGTDPDFDPVKIEGFSEILNLAEAQSPAYMIYPAPDTLSPKYQSSNPHAEVIFQWQTECIHVKDQAFQVVLKISDNPPNGGVKLATFKTWRITVVGPSPEWQSAILNPGPRSTQLNWNAYECQNAETMQVWRRVDSFAFTPAECETGMPEYAGYQLITELPVKDVNNIPVTSYLDTNNGNGLAPGAKYCYRLVALFPAPRGGESYVSDEICVGPILADAPVIMNVSVEKTGSADGRIFVRWTRPFQADIAQFPPPYQYRVYRGVGFAGAQGATPIAIITTDTTFTDVNLNTIENVYNYRIDCYANGGTTFVDKSASASSVRLEAKSLLKKIELNWSAFVPWSNQIQTVPNRHLIYRGPEGSDESQLVLIAEVDVSQGGFMYLDEGPLEDNQVYCYRIMTRGGYGSPQLEQPLLNFSQIICAQPGDETPPCKPEPPAPQVVTCNEANACDFVVFNNEINWERPEDTACRNDISYYNVYAANSSVGEYVLIASGIRETTYTDKDLLSYARCYKISAVDRSGNESKLSEPVCYDNCPYYELPNFFTPNGDKCNDVFSAYSTNKRPLYSEPNGEGGSVLICGGVNDESKCARFVEKVSFKVFNRWGTEVYTYQSGTDDGKSIYIDWNGRATNGSELASGIYYYVANVTFDTVYPDKKNKILKGWVQLLR